MRSWRENPDGEENQRATRQIEREIFALKMQHQADLENKPMKTETKHTWHAASTGNHQGLVIEETTGRNVAVTYDKADAPLIASAPAMAEELASLRAEKAALLETLRNAVACLKVCADDSEEAGYPSRAESVREDVKAYKAVIKSVDS